MSDDEITEFTELDPLELHLVSSAANKYTALLAKQEATEQKESKMTKANKKLLKSLGVNLAGPSASTAADRQSNTDLASLLRLARTQSESVDFKKLMKVFETRVTEAEAALAAARDPYEHSRAQSEYQTAARQRLMAKMVAADNARERRVLPRGRFGPNSADLFGGTSLTLPAEVGKGSTRYI